MHLYLCEYLNPRHLVQPEDPRWVVRGEPFGGARIEYDETILVDPEDLKPRREEMRAWKFGITNQASPQKRSRFYIDTLVWEEFDDDTCKTVEKILGYINAPFFNPDKSSGSGGEWVSIKIPASIVTEFVMTEVEFARSNTREALQRRHELCRGFYFDGDYAFGYWSPAWDPPRISPVTGEPLYAELWDRRDDYIRRASEWWEAVPRDKPEPMW
jgi:hypothetical protein